jgi:hypothetical protein
MLPHAPEENLFIYGLFQDNITSQDSIAWNGKMINEY